MTTDRLEEAIGFLATRPEAAVALAAVDSAISLRVLAGRSVDGLDAIELDKGPSVVSPELPPITGTVTVQAPAEPTTPAPGPPEAPKRSGRGSVPSLEETEAALGAVVIPPSDGPKQFVDRTTAEFGDDFDDFNMDQADKPPVTPVRNPDAPKAPKRAEDAVAADEAPAPTVKRTRAPAKPKTVVAEKIDAAIVELADGTIVGDGETIATLVPDDDADEFDALISEAAPKKKKGKRGKGKKGGKK